jgi:aspartate/methionine/tyrosine aminotransferase
MQLSVNIQRLHPSATIAVSTLAKRLKREGRDVIDLSAGQPDFDTPSWIAEAGIEGIRGGGTRYTPVAGIPELRGAISRYHGRGATTPLDPSGVVVSSGAKQALFNTSFVLFGPGDDVLIGAPYWTSYPEIVHLARANPVPVAGPAARGFKLSPETLDRAATPATRGLIFSSPSNPTGAVYSMAELRAIAEWARDRDIWLLSDEIYQEIYFGETPRAPGLLGLPPESRGPFVVINGASKSYAMTGWRIGFSYCDPELAAKIGALQSHTTSNAATPSQLAALAAYEDPDRTAATVDEMVRSFRRRRDLVVQRFGQLLPVVDFVEPEGAFYLFFRIDGAFTPECPDDTALCSRILEDVGVAMVPGSAFGDGRFARLSYATSDELLEESVKRIESVLRPALETVAG